MQRRLINICLSILFSITSIFVIFCFTLFNKNFVINTFDKYDLYKEILKENKDLRKKDIEKYLSSGYKSKIKSNSFSKYINLNYTLKNKIIIYVITFGSLIITGNIFNYTKKKHDLNKIIYLSSFILIMFYGYMYIFFDTNNMIVNKLIYEYIHYILAYSIIISEIIIFKKVMKKFNKNKE